MQKEGKIFRKRGSKAQMKMSFGMIFSIILIIIFLAFAFYVIKTLIEGQEKDLVRLFANDLKKDVESAWKGTQSSQEITYTLSKKIEYTCFVDYSSEERGVNEEFYRELRQGYYEYENLIFYPVGSVPGLDSVEIKYLNIEKITERDNPFCIENIDGKVKMTIKKNFGEEFVLIER